MSETAQKWTECNHCGKWMDAHDKACPACGKSRDAIPESLDRKNNSSGAMLIVVMVVVLASLVAMLKYLNLI